MELTYYSICKLSKIFNDPIICVYNIADGMYTPGIWYPGTDCISLKDNITDDFDSSLQQLKKIQKFYNNKYMTKTDCLIVYALTIK